MIAAAGVLVVAALTILGVSRVTASGHRDAVSVSYSSFTKTLSFRLPAFAGGTITSAQFAGKPLVLNFYASWCEVCNSEMPQFETAYGQLKNEVGFLGVNPQQGGSDADAGQSTMVARTGVTYPTARDKQSSLLSTFNTSGALPTTLFIDATAHVVEVYNGGLTQATLRQHISHDLGITA